MTIGYVIQKILTSSTLLFAGYVCLATLIFCIAYFLDEPVKNIKNKRQEKRRQVNKVEVDPDVIFEDFYN